MSGRKNALTVFVVSDLHAHCQEGEKTPSFLDIRADEANFTCHPISGLKKLIQDEQLQADLLLCPGDLGDKAIPEATRKAWEWLNSLGACLGVEQTLATAGNHDVDSRHAHNKHDARGVLQELRPRFPVNTLSEFDQYWSRHYVILVNPQYRIVLLNSAAYHGNAPDEYEKGRIAETTCRALREDLIGADDGRLNILLCHHHPHQHSEYGLGETDVMLGGQLLLDLLGSADFGDWVVIHGHKHHPKIAYAAATSGSGPIVFSAGSMSATLYPSLAAHVRNQVHLLRFDLDDIHLNGIRATVRSWDWAPFRGWAAAGDRSGLPREGGFGCRERAPELAGRVASAFIGSSMVWTEVVLATPSLKFVTPDDFTRIKRELQDRHGLSVVETGGQILALERIQ